MTIYLDIIKKSSKTYLSNSFAAAILEKQVEMRSLKTIKGGGGGAGDKFKFQTYTN